MPVKYRTYFNEPKIEAIEIIKETKKSVFFGKEREQKHSNYQNWHDSFDKAKAFLLDATESELCQTQDRISVLEYNIKRIKSLSEDNVN